MKCEYKFLIVFALMLILSVGLVIHRLKINDLEAKFDEHIQKLENNLDSVTVNGEFKGYIIDKNYIIKTEKTND